MFLNCVVYPKYILALLDLDPSKLSLRWCFGPANTLQRPWFKNECGYQCAGSGKAWQFILTGLPAQPKGNTHKTRKAYGTVMLYGGTIWLSSCLPVYDINAHAVFPWHSALQTFLHRTMWLYFLFPLPFKKKKDKHLPLSERIFVRLLAWLPLSICCLIYSFITLLPIICFYCPPSPTHVQITPVSLWMSFPVILWLDSWQ